jgi:hypothetical protein
MKMERTDVAILVNSTPKYYFILNFFFGMLRRYAPNLKWPVYFATEVPEDPVCALLKGKYGVNILTIPSSAAGFLESRWAALQMLSQYTYCLPLQDDFILEATMDSTAIRGILDFMDFYPDVASARLMPCPGPVATDPDVIPNWKLLTRNDTYAFVFQATLWRTADCLKWYEHICRLLEAQAPKAITDPVERRRLEISQNIAENFQGQSEFWKLFDQGSRHLAWIRRGEQPNAVYLSPFPYRPTAIVRGNYETWAQELAKREGF